MSQVWSECRQLGKSRALVGQSAIVRPQLEPRHHSSFDSDTCNCAPDTTLATPNTTAIMSDDNEEMETKPFKFVTGMLCSGLPHLRETAS